MEKIKSGFGLKGQYRIVTLRQKPDFIPVDAWLWAYRNGLLDSWVKRVSPLYTNMVMLGQDTGVNLIMQHLQGTTLFPLEIDNISLGTGATIPDSADTDLEAPVLENIIRAIGELTAINTLYTEWFVTDDELPDGEYHEIGLFCGDQIFARSIINPSHTKTPGEDTLFVYEIFGANT